MRGAARRVVRPAPALALLVLASLGTSVRADDLVSLGKAVDVAGPVGGTLVSIGGEVRLSGRVKGDLVVVGADAVLAEGARVDGDVLALGGTVRLSGPAPGAIGGRLLTVAAVEAAFLSELETSPVPGGARASLLLAFRLFLLFLWMVAGLLLLRLAPRSVSEAAGTLHGEAPRVGALGVAGVLTGLLASAFFVLSLPAAAGLGLAGTILLLLAAAKVYGLVAVSVALGRLMVRRAPRGSVLFGDPAALATGLLALGLLSLVPVAGKLLWASASIVGIGLSLSMVAGRGTRVPPVRAA